MALTVPVRGKIVVDGLRKDIELCGNEPKQCRRRSFADTQRAAGKPQVAKHERVAETVMIAAAAPAHGEVGLGQREVAYQLMRCRRRLEQRRDLGFAQPLPSWCHARLLVP